MLNKVRNGEELDGKILKKFLVENGLLQDESSSLEILQFTNGYSNLTYLLKAENKEWVLRRPPAGAIKHGHDMGREYKVLSNLSSEFDKAPSTYVFEESGNVLGTPFYLMEKINGISLNLKEAKNRKVSEDEFKLIASSWLDTFIELHRVDYQAAGLADLGKPAGYVERQVRNWSKQYVKAATMDIKEADFVMKWMDEHQPKEYDHCLIHNDFKYDNLIFEEGNWSQVNAVLDWEMCTLGDPMMDLGTSLGYWTMPSDGPALINGIPSPTLLPGNPSRSEVVEAFSQKSGKDINHLVFYYVYGLFKIAVIAQQIYYRYEKGLTTNEKFANLDKSCQFLCIMAKQAIEKKKIDHLF